MLVTLHIENIAVIEYADISFGPGLNILTGETGAGKSIVIDSINAVMGERVSRDVVRTGAKTAGSVHCSIRSAPLPPGFWRKTVFPVKRTVRFSCKGKSALREKRSAALEGALPRCLFCGRWAVPC